MSIGERKIARQIGQRIEQRTEQGTEQGKQEKREEAIRGVAGVLDESEKSIGDQYSNAKNSGYPEEEQEKLFKKQEILKGVEKKFTEGEWDNEVIEATKEIFRKEEEEMKQNLDYDLEQRLAPLKASYSEGNSSNRWTTEIEIKNLEKKIEEEKEKIQKTKEKRENWISEMRKPSSKEEIAEVLGKKEGETEKVEK